MADIRIVRNHALGFDGARRLALRWAEVAEQKLHARCVYEEGADRDVVRFERSGASGRLVVTPQRYELDVRLGFLLSMFRDRIEAEITKNVDELLAHDEPHGHFERRLAQHEARRRR